MNERYWTKEAEMNYLLALIDGSLWDHVPHRPTKSPVQLLRNYIRSAEKRIGWDTYKKDWEPVLSYAKAELERLES